LYIVVGTGLELIESIRMGDVRDLSNNMIKLQAQMQFAPAQPPRAPGNR
jgi:hypothetical protein